MRRYVAFAAALLLLLLRSQAVLAQYGPSGALTVSDPNPSAGGQITVSGSGFAPSSSVQITIESSSTSPELLATVDTDATGAFSESVTIPASASGPYTITATGTDPAGSVLVLTASVDVVGISLPPTGTSPVPSTGRSGSDSLVIAIAGIGIVLMTGAVLFTTRRLRSLR